MLSPRRIQRFEVIDHLGSGGMGSVYRARDPQLERDVAIKLLFAAQAPGELSFSETIDLRGDVVAGPDDLLREARMMARLSHPNVLPVYEVGLSDGSVFLVMEHIDGADLSTWLQEPRSTQAILDVFAQAAHGLRAAHQRGIVHRDIKPANILIGADGRVRVADFGLSRLTDRSAPAMVRAAEGGGTPHYMAPELWSGRPATTASDVFALCTALLDALGVVEPAARDRVLRERGVRPRLRDVLVRGLAADPAERPTVDQLLRAIEDRVRSWRVWAAAAVVAGAAAGGVLLALPGVLPGAGAGETACETDGELAALWTPQRRTALRAALAGGEGFAGDAADRVIADLDAQVRHIQARHVGACRAARAGEITEAQRRMRASCLDRRSFELAGNLEFLRDNKPSLTVAREAVSSLKLPDECSEMVAPPIAADRAAVDALWRRYAHSRALAVPARVAEQVAELTAIEVQATELGEAELAGCAARWVAAAYRWTDRMAEADQALQRASRIAIELRMTNLAARSLVDRAAIAFMRGDAQAAKSYGELSRDIADRPTTQPATRAAVYCALGRAALTRGDGPEAVEHLHHGLELLRSTRTNYPPVELACRYSLFEALGIAPAPPGVPDPLTLARQTAEYARIQMGEHDTNHGLALTQVASALAGAGDLDAAIVEHRKALELIRATMPPDSSNVVVTRARLARYLYDAGKLAVAGKELEQLLADIQSNESVRSQRPTLAGLLAHIQFELGRTEEGHALQLEALEDSIAVLGVDHDHTLQLRSAAAVMELEMGQTRSAARHLDALERGLRERPDGHPPYLLEIGKVLRAELAIQQGRPRAAERAMRAALRDPKTSDDWRAAHYHTLGSSLVARGKHAAARRALLRSLALARKTASRPDKLAAFEAKLAVAEARMGRKAAARARARRIRKILAGTGHLLARADVEWVLARRRARR